MGLFDEAAGKVGDIAGKASDLLDSATGGQKTGESKGKAKFVKDENLSDLEKKSTIPVGPKAPGDSSKSANKPNPINDSLTEFIHFGQVHADSGNKFSHNKFTPSVEKNVPNGHGVMFRDALEREAIMLFGFITSTKQAVIDTTKNRGAVEEIGAMASNLMGGSNTTAKPDPKQLDKFIKAVKEETAKINKADIVYKEIHEAGKKFHETRADYYAFCESLDTFYLKPPKSEGIGAIGDAIGSAAANIPGVGKILGVVQRIAFKVLDLYLATFLELRKSHERMIELSAHKLTVDAIKANYEKHLPTYPVWFPTPKEEEAEEEITEEETEEEQEDPNGISTKKYTDAIGKEVKEKTDDVKKKVDDTKKKGQEVVDDIYDFAGGNADPEPSEASPILAEIFSQLKGENKDTTDTGKEKPLTASDAIAKGLDATLSDIGGVPGFMKKVIGEITEANVGLLEEVFKRLMAKNADAEINSRMLLEAGRRHLIVKLTTMGTKLIMGMVGESVPTPNVDAFGQNLGATKSEDDYGINAPGGKKLSAKQLLAKQIDEKLGKYIEPILQFAIGDLAGQLEASRKIAVKEKANTMEVYLGRLPWLNAMMFRNTFFPMWNLVAEEAFGAISPPLKSALKEINGLMNKAKDEVDKVQEYKRRAEKVKKDAEELKDEVSGGSFSSVDDITKKGDAISKKKDQADRDANTETAEGMARRAEREAAEQEKEALDSFYEENDKDKEFPVTARIADGESKKVEEEVESVLPPEAV